MKVYAVRVKESKELVGIFTVTRPDALFWMVDEVVDPAETEWMELPVGCGVIFPDGGSGQLVSDEDGTFYAFIGALPNNLLDSALVAEDAHWEPVPAQKMGHKPTRQAATIT